MLADLKLVSCYVGLPDPLQYKAMQNKMGWKPKLFYSPFFSGLPLLQEGSARTGVLRTALASVQESLAELRVDHDALTAAHSKLLAKDLMKTGLLKDRWEGPGGEGWGCRRNAKGGGVTGDKDIQEVEERLIGRNMRERAKADRMPTRQGGDCRDARKQ
jgi:hypothetical protein